MSDSSNNHQAAYSGSILGAKDDPSDQGVGREPACPKGTMVILLPERAKGEAPDTAPTSVDSSSLFRLIARGAMVASAAAIGGVAGSLATFGISRLTTTAHEMPSHY